MKSYEVHFAVQQILFGKPSNQYTYTMETVGAKDGNDARKLIESKYAGTGVRIQRTRLIG